MPDWPEQELAAHAAWLDAEKAEENFLATGIPSQEEIEAQLERLAFA
jgi:hypothetical protein